MRGGEVGITREKGLPRGITSLNAQAKLLKAEILYLTANNNNNVL
jgi:hypothetical protein